MALKLMGMGWGRGNFPGDGADVHYCVTLYSVPVQLFLNWPEYKMYVKIATPIQHFKHSPYTIKHIQSQVLLRDYCHIYMCM